MPKAAPNEMGGGQRVPIWTGRMTKTRLRIAMWLIALAYRIGGIEFLKPDPMQMRRAERRRYPRDLA